VIPEPRTRMIFAVLYLDDEGKERSIWYSKRENAQRAAKELKRQARVKTFHV
jgi:hypothetical protein